ncbi:hypothetical protein V6N11_059840 [Hibiscus sabdariffa]|uniref:Uncharacterized protein n=2 Tax=Hibiscus sabdariffa TaxID=183260 RepID=A0ABR2NYF9_9ROSI
MNIFTKKPNPKEALRESKREITRATRELEYCFDLKFNMHCGLDSGIEKEIGTLQLEEKKLVAEIKRTAKTGNEAATKTLARQLVRLRQQIAKLQSSRAQIRGISTHTQAMHAQSSVAAGMKGATKAMSAMNKQMAPHKQAKVIQEFQKQSAMMDMTTEMMSDAIDDALDDDEAEDETEDITNQVLDEIGVDVASQVSILCFSPLFILGFIVNQIPYFAQLSDVSKIPQLSPAPKGRIAGKNTEAIGSSGVDELEKRLAALRNP